MSGRSSRKASVRARLRGPGVALAIAACLLLVGAGVASAAGTSVKMVEAGGRYAFSPATRFVHVGDTVTWTNTSDAPHTVTSDSAGAITSGTMNAGKTFSMTFSSTGSIAYHCTIHSYMHGTIDVLAADATLPPTDTGTLAASQPARGGSDGWGSLLIGLSGLVGGAAVLLWNHGARPR